jgi:hypothetical protein
MIWMIRPPPHHDSEIMAPDLISQLQAEERNLTRKLEAVRTMLAAYGAPAVHARSRGRSSRSRL